MGSRIWKNETEAEDAIELKEALDWAIEKNLLSPYDIPLMWYDADTVIHMYRRRNPGYYMYPFGITTERIDEQVKLAKELIEEVIAEEQEKT